MEVGERRVSSGASLVVSLRAHSGMVSIPLCVVSAFVFPGCRNSTHRGDTRGHFHADPPVSHRSRSRPFRNSVEDISNPATLAALQYAWLRTLPASLGGTSRAHGTSFAQNRSSILSDRTQSQSGRDEPTVTGRRSRCERRRHRRASIMFHPDWRSCNAHSCPASICSSCGECQWSRFRPEMMGLGVLPSHLSRQGSVGVGRRTSGSGDYGSQIVHFLL